MADNQDELIAQFQSITDADTDRARFYLESSAWKIDLAVAQFYEGGPAAGEGEAMDTGAAGAAAAANPSPAVQESGSAGTTAGAAAAPKGEASKSSGGSRIATMASMLRSGDDDSDEDDGDDDEKSGGQAFFAGGSTQSGQQILGPPSKKKGADFVSEVFRRARQSGAEVVEGAGLSGGQGPSGGASAFSGSAFRLGSEAGATPAAPTVQGAPKPTPPREFTIRLWQNGFSVDDGELRSYTEPGNREFMAHVMTGRIPHELVREARGGEVGVNLEDHKHEDYVKPKASRKPFQGQGHMLGSVAPQVASGGASAAAAAAAPTSAEDKTKNESAAKEHVKLKDGEPTTNVQVRLNDGSRLVVRLNHDHTVGQLREYISVARPNVAAAAFDLHMTFPNKRLDDDALTLKDAGLLNAAVMLRPK